MTPAQGGACREWHTPVRWRRTTDAESQLVIECGACGAWETVTL